MSPIYDGQFYGNVLVVRRTGCSKNTFLEKLALNKCKNRVDQWY